MFLKKTSLRNKTLTGILEWRTTAACCSMIGQPVADSLALEPYKKE